MRRHYACDEMKAEIKALKKSGVSMFFCTTSYMKEEKTRYLKPVVKKTAEGISAYANEMYLKYGDTVVVEVSYFDINFDRKVYTTYAC